MSEEEKEFLLKQANMYLSGMSFREISKEIGISHVSVRTNITKKIKDVEPQIYEMVMNKISENTEKTINDSEVRERVLMAYKLLTEENKTILEIAKTLNTTEFTIYRDLSVRLAMLKDIAPDIVTEEMLEKVAIVFQKHYLANIDQEPIKIELLYKMFPNENKRKDFLTKCILTFSLRLDTLSTILKEDKNELFKYLVYNGNPLFENVTMVFEHTMKDQTKAREKFESFFRRLTNASLSGNKKKIESVLGELSDKKVKKILKSGYSSIKDLSNEDVIAILKYQIKYMLDTNTIERIFNLERHSYSNRIRKLENEYPELVSDFNYLNGYYQNLYLLNERKGRKW